VTRATEILDLVAQLAPSPAMSDLRAGVDRREPRALAALAEIKSDVTQILEMLLGLLAQLRDAAEWNVLREKCKLASDVAVGLGVPAALATTMMFLALANRRLRDVIGALSAYGAAIDAAACVGPAGDQTRAIAHDNRGNLLGEVGRLDDALADYDSAMRFEHRPLAQQSIRANKANALAALGDFRAAASLHAEVITALESEHVDRYRLALALDNAGQAIRELGDLNQAGVMLERARELLPPDDLGARAVNAIARSDLALDRGDDAAAAAAFTQAHDLEFERARREIDATHYDDGFSNARRHAMPFGEAMDLLAEAIRVPPWETDDPFTPLKEAATIARSKGDLALALRIEANLAGRLFDAGDSDRALELCWRIQSEASQNGLAYAESGALGMLGSLGAQGVDVRFPLGPLSAYVFATVLFERHVRTVEVAGLGHGEALYETFDNGYLDNQLAKFATDRRAYRLAIGYLERGVSLARSQGLLDRLLNRLSGLALAKEKSGDRAGAEVIDAEIEDLLAQGPVPPRGEIAARRRLADRLADVELDTAIQHLRRAVDLLEHMRMAAPPGEPRADVGRDFAGLASFLSNLLRKRGDEEAAFDALQGDKARRTMAVLANLHGGDDRPTTAREIGALLPADSLLIDIAMRSDGITAYVVSADGDVESVDVDGEIEQLIVDRGDLRDRQARLIKCALESPLLRDLVSKLTEGARAGLSIFLIPDGPLHTLPVHATPSGGRAWYEQAAVAQLPAAGVLRFPCARRQDQPRSFVAGDSDRNLPHAAVEVRTVARLLDCRPHVGTDCTRAALELALGEGGLDIVHLAVHGRGDVRRGGRASLLFASGGGVEWVPFDRLARLRWRARLVVFSGCSTAVNGPRQGAELVGVARAALEAGAGAVVASLWPVGDEAAMVAMVAFYESLGRRFAAGVTDIRLALDDARHALRSWLRNQHDGPRRARDGREWPTEGSVAPTGTPVVSNEVAQALQWAPFVLIGNPIWE
jgi:CHAT domain-containing protein/tetratricopeptide (TPR) repeat protein